MINKGIVDAKDMQRQFVFRQFLNMPIGFGFLYPVEKSLEHLEKEMSVLETGDRNIPVRYKSINAIWPIYWEDDMPEIPVGLFNIYLELYHQRMVLVEVEPAYKWTHFQLYAVFRKYYNGGGNIDYSNIMFK